jgi:hypothetical protein
MHNLKHETISLSKGVKMNPDQRPQIQRAYRVSFRMFLEVLPERLNFLLGSQDSITNALLPGIRLPLVQQPQEKLPLFPSFSQALLEDWSNSPAFGTAWE